MRIYKIVEIVLAAAFAAFGVLGMRLAIACHYDWPAIGAAVLMFAWSARWLFRAKRVTAIGFIAAAAGFATDYHRPFGWWAVIVAILFVIAAYFELRPRPSYAA